MTIPTPDLSHLTKMDYNEVYEPAEDTFLLLDALETDAESLKSDVPLICLEVGLRHCFHCENPRPIIYLCTDINPHACRCTRLTGLQNKVDIQVVNGSLTTPFQSRLARRIDVILFNPPYVPTSKEEASNAQNSRNIGGSWAGGADGMEITNDLLRRIEELLSPIGRFYLVALKQNNVPRIIQIMKDEYSLTGKVVLQRRAGGEHLFVICFIRQDNIAQQ